MAERLDNSNHPPLKTAHEPSAQSREQAVEQMFFYFAYGSCMCPVDLKRTLGESTHPFVVGPATLQGYRLGFYRRSVRRNCGVLDVVSDPASVVHGVLYALPWRLSDRLDEREEVPSGGYRRQTIEVYCQHQLYTNVRTYVVVDKLDEELAPNDWYFNVVLRGAVTCGLPEQYCWQLFEHMHRLQQHHWQGRSLDFFKHQSSGQDRAVSSMERASESRLLQPSPAFTA